MCLDPREALGRALRLGKAQHRREQQRLAAAVVLVVEVAPHAAAGRDGRLLDPLDELGPADEEQRSVEAIVRPQQRFLAALIGAEPVADSHQRHHVDVVSIVQPRRSRVR